MHTGFENDTCLINSAGIKTDVRSWIIHETDFYLNFKVAETLRPMSAAKNVSFNKSFVISKPYFSQNKYRKQYKK